MQDRFVKIMLVVVAGLLAANLMQSVSSNSAPSVPLFLNSAQAQARNTSQSTDDSRTYQLKTLTGFPVKDLKSIVSVGDGRSFVASNSEGFMVYQVVPSTPVNR